MHSKSDEWSNPKSLLQTVLTRVCNQEFSGFIRGSTWNWFSRTWIPRGIFWIKSVHLKVQYWQNLNLVKNKIFKIKNSVKIANIKVVYDHFLFPVTRGISPRSQYSGDKYFVRRIASLGLIKKNPREFTNSSFNWPCMWNSHSFLNLDLSEIWCIHYRLYLFF